MVEKFLTCATCPKECTLKIVINNNKLELVTGHGCKRGITYAENELYHPKRIITTTVIVSGGNEEVLAVRSNIPISKDLFSKSMDVINKTIVVCPVKRGDIIVENILNSGVNIIASKTIKRI